MDESSRSMEKGKQNTKNYSCIFAVVDLIRDKSESLYIYPLL